MKLPDNIFQKGRKMNDSLKLYRNIAEFVFKYGMRFHDLRCFVTFLWAMVGLIQSRTVHLSQWCLHRPGRANAASKQRQLMRWLENPHTEPTKVYQPLIGALCQAFQGERLFLALDSSVLWERFVLIRVAMVYRGRALPLSWKVMESESAAVAFKTYQPLLKQAAQVLPAACRVVLLADRGFVDHRVFKAARDLGWGFRVRLKSTIWVGHPQRSITTVGALMPKAGQALFIHRVWLTKHWLGPVHLALAHVQTPKGFEQWAIVSDEPTDLHTLDEFGLRFDIEENFLDDKSAGFQLESSQIRDAAALARLCLVLATSTLYLVSCGSQVVANHLRRQVDAHWQRGLSFLQIGWRWLSHALSNDLSLPSHLRLLPQIDFDLAVASKRQSVRPIASLFALSLLT